MESKYGSPCPPPAESSDSGSNTMFRTSELLTRLPQREAQAVQTDWDWVAHRQGQGVPPAEVDNAIPVGVADNIKRLRAMTCLNMCARGGLPCIYIYKYISGSFCVNQWLASPRLAHKVARVFMNRSLFLVIFGAARPSASVVQVRPPVKSPIVIVQATSRFLESMCQS
jgi:hypothetical protein